MAIDTANMSHVGQIAGKTVLFIGNECKDWTIGRFVQAAQEARALGVDTISPKRLNGTERWYNTVDQLQNEARAVHAVGCGYMPFAYGYGPAIRPNFVLEECALLTEIQEAMGALQPDGIGFAGIDLEAEYNGQTAAATLFNKAMQNKHLLYLTSWADPAWQSWNSVLSILRDCINAYVPQAYSDQLNSLMYQQIPADLCVQPAVDLSQEFGVNHPVDIASQARQHGYTTVWMWDYAFIGSQAASVRGVVRAMAGAAITPTPAPVPPPAPAPAPQLAYTIQPGDTLILIAKYHDIADWRTLLNYHSNHAALDAVARLSGYPDSHNGDLIFPGTVIELP